VGRDVNNAKMNQSAKNAAKAFTWDQMKTNVQVVPYIVILVNILKKKSYARNARASISYLTINVFRNALLDMALTILPILHRMALSQKAKAESASNVLTIVTIALPSHHVISVRVMNLN